MPEKLLITGVSGFVGSYVLREALEAGHEVVGVVMDEIETDKIRDMNVYDGHRDKLTFKTVPSMKASGAYDSLIEGVTGIIHVAGPTPVPTSDPYESIFVEIIEGTKNILQAANQAPSLKKLVITSSIAALADTQTSLENPETVITNATPAKQTEVHEDDPNPLHAYQEAKRAQLAYIHFFQEMYKPTFDIVTISPGAILGPKLDARSQRDYMMGSNALLLAPLKGAKAEAPFLGTTVHVADVGKLHVAALSPDVKSGNYLASSNPPKGTDWDAALNFGRHLFPDAVAAGILSSEGEQTTVPLLVDSSVTEKAFDIKFKGWEEQVRETVQHYLSLPGK